MIICLDTPLLIYALQDDPGPDKVDQDLHRQSRSYLQWFSEKSVPVLLPTPLIGEFLTGRDRKVRLEVVTALTRFADVRDFDLRAATLASELRTTYWEAHKLPKGLKGQVLSVDMMIAAIALTNQATMIVTNDVDDFRRIVGDRIIVRGIMEGAPGQGSLFH